MKEALYRFFALWLALIWLPATAHCRIEALGVELASCAEACHGETSSEASHDGCEVVENGLYKSSVAPLKVAPAVLLSCLCLASHPPLVAAPDPGPLLASAEAGRERAWVPTWHFVRRAAAPAHAPDALNA